MAEGHVDATTAVHHVALLDGDEVYLEASQHGAVHLDGDFLEFIADNQAFELALRVAQAQQVVDLHVAEARAETERISLPYLDAGLAFVHPQQTLALRLGGLWGGHRAVFHRCVGPLGREGDAVDAALAMPALGGHGPLLPVVIVTAVGVQRECLSKFRLANGVVPVRHAEERDGRLPQALYLDVHLARQGVAVDVDVLHLEVVQCGCLFPTLQREEGGAEAHAQRGHGGVALAVDVGYVHADLVLEGGLIAELDAAVGFGGEEHLEAAVGGGGQFALGHSGAIFIAPPAPPPAVQPAARDSILHARTRDGHGAVAGGQPLDTTGSSEPGRFALGGLEGDHELGLFVFLHAHRGGGEVLGMGTHVDAVEARDAVGGQGEACAGDAEVVGAHLDGVAHALAIGVDERHLERQPGFDHCLDPVALEDQRRHLHLLARLVDGAVGAELGLQVHAGLVRLGVSDECRSEAVAAPLGHQAAPTEFVESEAVAPVGAGGGALQHRAVAFHPQLLSGDGAAGGAVEQQAIAAVLDEEHVGAVDLIGHEAVPLEVGGGRDKQDVATRLECRHGHEGALLLVLFVGRHIDVPSRQRLGGEQLRLGLVGVVEILHVGDQAQPEVSRVAVVHMVQACAAGGDGEVLAAHFDHHLRNLLAQVGALHAALALGGDGGGAVAPAQGLYIVALLSALLRQAGVKQGVELAPRATEAVEVGLQVAALKGAVGHLAVEVVLSQGVPDAEVVGIGGVELDESALPVEALLGREVAAILHHNDNHVVDGRGDVEGLAAGGIVFDLPDGGLLEQGLVLQGCIVLAEEGVAEGLLEGFEAGQEAAVARCGAVVGVLLVHGGGLGHIPCRAQPLGAGGAGERLCGALVGGGVAAVVDEAVYLLPVGL